MNWSYIARIFDWLNDLYWRMRYLLLLWVGWSAGQGVVLEGWDSLSFWVLLVGLVLALVLTWLDWRMV